MQPWERMPDPQGGPMDPGSFASPGWGIPTPAIPRPRGIPNRSLFLAGAVGSFVAAGAAIPFAYFTLASGLGLSMGSLFSVEALTAGVLMSVGVALHLVGTYGLWRNYGSRVALAAVLSGLAALPIFITIMLYLVLTTSLIYFVFAFTGFVVIGVMFILDGIAYIANRHFVLPGVSMATGVLSIVAGGFLCSVELGFMGGLIAMPALIVGGIVLASTPIPVSYAPHPDTGPAGPG